MTKEFDALLESMLAEMMPAHMMDDFGPGPMTDATVKKVGDLSGPSQHWGPIQKLPVEKRAEVVRAILNKVFTEKGNTYTPMADNRDQLKNLIMSAIVATTKEYPEFKAGGKWAPKFLADRLANEELFGKVKYETEEGKEIKKDVTQKELTAALNSALADTKSQSVWKRSHQIEEVPAEKEPAVEEAPEEEAIEDKQVQTVYIKAADLSSDDSDLQKAFEKLPDNKEMSWEEVIKKVGTSKALALLDAGGLSEEEKEIEPGEDEEVPALDAADDEAPDLSNFDRLINPYYSDTRGSFDRFHGDY